MGKVTVKLTLTNQGDLVLAKRKLSKARPRSVEVEALVDTGATRLYLRPSVIKALGLEKVDDIISQTINGPRKRAVYEPVRLDLQGRYGNFGVMGVGEEQPNRLGTGWCINLHFRWGERPREPARQEPRPTKLTHHRAPARSCTSTSWWTPRTANSSPTPSTATSRGARNTEG